MESCCAAWTYFPLSFTICCVRQPILQQSANRQWSLFASMRSFIQYKVIQAHYSLCCPSVRTASRPAASLVLDGGNLGSLFLMFNNCAVSDSYLKGLVDCLNFSVRSLKFPRQNNMGLGLPSSWGLHSDTKWKQTKSIYRDGEDERKQLKILKGLSPLHTAPACGLPDGSAGKFWVEHTYWVKYPGRGLTLFLPGKNGQRSLRSLCRALASHWNFRSAIELYYSHFIVRENCK